jgi:hypothetical protein
MKKILLATTVAVSTLSGCASVAMEVKEQSETTKQFKPPTDGNAGLYIYRLGSFGGALKKDVWVDGKCIGETAPNIFFYEEVLGGEEHKVSTESEFSSNNLMVNTEGGKNYFVRQYIKMGAFVGGAGVELVDDERGKKEVAELTMAKNGPCSS